MALTATHLAFSLSRSEVRDRILVPKYYDPELQECARLAETAFDLLPLRDLLCAGYEGSRLGTWIRREFYGTGSIPFVRTSDLSQWRVRPDYKKGVSDEVYESVRARQDVAVGDILFVAHGTYLIGTVALVTEDEPKLVLQDHVFRLRVRAEAPVKPEYVLAALSTSFVRRQVRSRQFSADIIDKIGERHLDLLIPVPKQLAVHDTTVSGVQEVISAQSQNRRDIKLATQSDLRMTRERAEARFGFPVSRGGIKNRILIPKYYDPVVELALGEAEAATGAEWTTLGQLVDDGTVAASTGVEVGKMAYGTGTVPFLRTSDIADLEVKIESRHGVSEEIYRQYQRKAGLEAGDILLVRDGTYLVGSTALVSDDDVPALFCGGMYRIRVLDDSKISPHSLLAALNHPLVRRQLRARQFTRDVIDTLGNRLHEVKLPRLGTEEFDEITSQMQRVMQSKEIVKRRITALISSIEPPAPAQVGGRPSWSMR